MLGGAMALVKSGAGLLTLAGSNSFYGGVTLNSGMLTISNALAAGMESSRWPVVS